MKYRNLSSLFALIFSFVCFNLQATTVEFQTSQGNIQVNLFDETTPKTVANFLNYVNEGHYNNVIIHRSVPGFVIQGGGFIFEGSWDLTRLATHASVENEPVYSNVKGTIAMAKLSGDPDSATDQWFFNLADNSANLDQQNGGFTVFGQVIGDADSQVIDAIAALTTCSDRPVVDFTSEQCTSGAVPGAENLVTVYQIVIMDSSVATAANLSPVKNTLINANSTNNSSSTGSSGGTMFWLVLLSAIGLVFNSRRH